MIIYFIVHFFHPIPLPSPIPTVHDQNHFDTTDPVSRDIFQIHLAHVFLLS